MSLDLTNASNYVEAKSQEIITSGLQGGSETAQHLISTSNVQFGVKGETAILKMDADVNLQDASICGARTAIGSIRLSDAKIKANPIKDIKDICTRELYNTYYSFMALNKGAYQGEELNEAFADYVMTFRAKKIAATIEKIYWQGDVTSTDVNLKRFDGILKKIAAPVAANGADVVSKLQYVVSNTDVDLMANEDFTIYVGKDTHNAYKMELANRNIFQLTDDNSVFGTTAKLVVVSGLNGTGKVVATRSSNLQLALDGEGDADKATLDFDRNLNIFRQDFHFSTGIAVVYTDEAKAYTI